MLVSVILKEMHTRYPSVERSYMGMKKDGKEVHDMKNKNKDKNETITLKKMTYSEQGKLSSVAMVAVFENPVVNTCKKNVVLNQGVSNWHAFNGCQGSLCGKRYPMTNVEFQPPRRCKGALQQCACAVMTL